MSDAPTYSDGTPIKEGDEIFAVFSNGSVVTGFAYNANTTALQLAQKQTSDPWVGITECMPMAEVKAFIEAGAKAKAATQAADTTDTDTAGEAAETTADGDESGQTAGA